MTDLLYPFVEFDFMRRALAGSLIISLSAAPVGVFMVLRRISLMGDALSHAVLPGVAIGYLVAGLSVTAMALGGLLAGCLVALASGLSSRWSTVPEDRNLAAWYLIALALGVFLISVRGGSVDLMHVLFGAALGLGDAALVWVGATATATIWVLLMLFRPLVFDSVDPGSLSVGLMILPGTIASYWCQRLDSLLVMAVALAGLASVAGLLGSFYADWPTSPTVILGLGIAYLLSVLLGRRQGLVRALWFRAVQTKQSKELRK